MKTGINIQDEVAKIHHQYGTTEKANYEIEKLFEHLLSQSHQGIDWDEVLRDYTEDICTTTHPLTSDEIALIKWLKSRFPFLQRGMTEEEIKQILYSNIDARLRYDPLYGGKGIPTLTGIEDAAHKIYELLSL